MLEGIRHQHLQVGDDGLADGSSQTFLNPPSLQRCELHPSSPPSEAGKGLAILRFASNLGFLAELGSTEAL